MPRQSSIANVGTMPFEMYIKKYGKTGEFVEDPEAMRNHQRNLLSDFRPEPPCFESDMPRRQNNREQMLNVRFHGTRSELTPQLPDGTFLDYDFLAADPRGHTREYNWNRYKQEGMTRAGNVKFSSDDAFTTHEGPIGGYGMIRRRTEATEDFKHRWKNFATSKDTLLRGHMKTDMVNDICNQTTDRNPLIDEAICNNNTNIVSDLSRTTPIGYNTTGDHEFKIASYSQVRGTRSLADDDWARNRGRAQTDYDEIVKYKDNMVSKSIALSMIDLSQKKYNETQSLRNYKFANSMVTGVRQQKFIKNTIENSLNADAASYECAGGELGAQMRRGRQRPALTSKGSSRISHELAKTMVAATKSRKIDSKDLRESVRYTVLNENSMTTETRKGRFITKSEWEGVEDRKINGEAEKLIYNFKVIKPKLYSKTDEIDNVVFDDYKSTSKSMDPRIIRSSVNMDRHTSSYTDGMKFAEHTAAANPSVSVGSKYTYDKIDGSMEGSEIFDM